MLQKQRSFLLGLMVLCLLGCGLVLMETFASHSLPPGQGQAHSAEAEPAPAQPPAQAAPPAQLQEEDPWTLAWSNQQQYYQDIFDATNQLYKQLPELTREVTRAVAPFQRDAQRLFVFTTTYQNNPRVLEAVERRIAETGNMLRNAMAPAESALSTAQDLLDKVTQLESTIPAERRADPGTNKEFRTYLDSLAQARKKINDSIARLNNAMTPGKGLEERINKALAGIDEELPHLWQRQYVTPPVRYLDNANWDDMTLKLASMTQTFSLRMVMEFPQTQGAWEAAGMRFITILLFGTMLTVFAYRKLRNKESGETFLHIFKTSMPWLLVGLSLLVASVSSGGTVYRALLSLGNLLLIVGQISLAWDLRRIDRSDIPKRSPYWSLCMPTLVGYVLIYPDMPINILAASWAAVLVAALIWHRLYRRNDLPLQIESTFLQLDPAILWLALFMVVFGLPRYSILLYLVFVTLAVAMQLSLGCMHLIHAASEHLPKEGAKAIMGSLLIACAAPAVLILVAVGVALWVVTLPGGFYLLRHYAVSGISVGATHFSALQALFIISGFYITRAAVSMGSAFLTRLPEHGINIDSTLIPSMRTAFTYALWALFGAFVLKSLGMELSNLAVVAGGLSVGIGFGMQTIVNNFLSGLILIFSRILQEGDVVEVGGLLGVVRKISVRATTVETYDNAVIYVPNAEFVSNRLINWTRNSRSVRREIKIGVAYGTDPTLVMRLLRQTADSSPNVLKYPSPSVIFTDFADSTLNFSLRFWVHDYDKGVSTASDIRVAIEKTFRQHNVEVAFPQLDVHIRDMPRVGKNPPPKPVAPSAPVQRGADPHAQKPPTPLSSAVRRRLYRPRTGKAALAGSAAAKNVMERPEVD